MMDPIDATASSEPYKRVVAHTAVYFVAGNQEQSGTTASFCMPLRGGVRVLDQ